MSVRRKKPKVVKAWAWKCDFGLCFWAAPTRRQLLREAEKPSPEARAVRVEIREVTRKGKRT